MKNEVARLPGLAGLPQIDVSSVSVVSAGWEKERWNGGGWVVGSGWGVLDKGREKNLSWKC